MGTVIVSGLPREATSHETGIPFSWATFVRDIALTREETPMITRVRKDVQAIMRAIWLVRYLMRDALAFFEVIVILMK